MLSDLPGVTQLLTNRVRIPIQSRQKQSMCSFPVLCFLGLQKGLGHRSPGRSWPCEAGLQSQTLGNCPKPLTADLSRLLSRLYCASSIYYHGSDFCLLSCMSEPGLNNMAVRLGTHTLVGPPEVHCSWVSSVLVAIFLVFSHLHNCRSCLPGVLCLNGPGSLWSILGPQPRSGQDSSQSRKRTGDTGWGQRHPAAQSTVAKVYGKLIWAGHHSKQGGSVCQWGKPWATNGLGVFRGLLKEKRPFGWSSENGQRWSCV